MQVKVHVDPLAKIAALPLQNILGVQTTNESDILRHFMLQINNFQMHLNVLEN